MSSQLVGYLITGLWTLVNVAVVVVILAVIVVSIIFLHKYLHKSDIAKKDA